MVRTPKNKILKNSRLLKDYASWIYCTECNNTVAYLCYTSYDLFDFIYKCNCGSHGEVHIEFDHNKNDYSNNKLKIVKNRMCCPNDDSPLITIIDKNIDSYEFDILCNNCNKVFNGKN